jgi:hypothetical protein
MFPKQQTLPGDDGPGLDEGEGILPASPETTKLDPEEPIGGRWDEAVVGRSSVGKWPPDDEAPRPAGAATGVTKQAAKQAPQRRNHEDHSP